MPRMYVKKKGAPPYTIKDIKNAVQDVANSKKTYREASLFYNVPTTVIFNRTRTALSTSLINETSPQKDSPTKENLESIFNISTKSSKHKNIVIPRLKQSNYGEILTTQEVMERLRAAQEEKDKKELKRKIKKENNGKGKGIGKRSKLIGKSKPRPPKSDSEDDTLIPYAESDDSIYNVENELDNSIEFLEPVASKIKAGDFVLAIFKGGKRMTTNFKYVCHVDTVDEDDEINVTALKCAYSTKELFTFNDADKSSVTLEDVIGVLSEPGILMKGERACYKFRKPVDVFEKA